jgi:hypothetical protein
MARIGRRRADPLAGVWDSEIVPILKAAPGPRIVLDPIPGCPAEAGFDSLDQHRAEQLEFHRLAQALERVALSSKLLQVILNIPGRDYSVSVGGIIPLRRATSSRYDGRLEKESASRNRAARA